MPEYEPDNDAVRSALAPLRPDPKAAKARKEADAPGVAVFTEVMRRNPASQWLDNKYEQSQHFKGIIYLAVMALADAMSGATIKIQKRRRVDIGDEDEDGFADQDLVSRKSLFRKSTGAGEGNSHGGEDEYTPVSWEHPANRLFEFINDVDTWADFMTQWEIQENLTGEVYIYVPKNRAGLPCELWIIPTAMTQAIPISPSLPYGAIRVNNVGAYLVSFLPAGSCTLNGEDVLIYRRAGSMYRQTGYSPLTAGDRQLDILEAIDEARKSAMDHGVNPDIIAALKGASPDQLKEFVTDLGRKAGGSGNHRKTIAVDAESVDIKAQATSAKDMDFPTGWDQMIKFASALFGVPPAVMGLTEASSYAEFYAKLKQYHTLKLVPNCKKKSAFLTKHLIRKYYGDDLYAEIVVPKIDDAEMRLRELGANASDLWTYNEARASLNLPPVSDGDQPTSIVIARRQSAIQQQEQEEQQRKQAEMMAQQQQQLPSGAMPGAEHPPQDQQQPEQSADSGEDPSAMLEQTIQEALGLNTVQKAITWTIKTTKDGSRYVEGPNGQKVYGARAEAIIQRMGMADKGGNVYEEGDTRTHHGPANFLGGAHDMRLPAKPVANTNEPNQKQPGLGEPPVTPGKESPNKAPVEPTKPQVPADEPANQPAGYLGGGKEPRSGGMVVEGVKKDGSPFHQEFTNAMTEQEAEEMAKLVGAHAVTKINGKAKQHAQKLADNMTQAVPVLASKIIPLAQNKQLPVAKLLPQLEQPKTFAQKMADKLHGPLSKVMGTSPQDTHAFIRSIVEGFSRGLLMRLTRTYIPFGAGGGNAQSPQAKQEAELGKQALKLGAEEEKAQKARVKAAKASPDHPVNKLKAKIRESRDRIREHQRRIARHRIDYPEATDERNDMRRELNNEQAKWNKMNRQLNQRKKQKKSLSAMKMFAKSMLDSLEQKALNPEEPRQS